MTLSKASRLLPAALAALFAALPGARAADDQAQSYAHPWQLWHPEPVTPTMEWIEGLHFWLLIVSIGICTFVFALMAYALWRFSERRNPTPSRTAHNTFVEVLWTVVPVLILVSIAVPSFRLLYAADRDPNAEMTLKATGHQWYWSYEYPDQGNLAFDALIVPEADLPPEQKGLRLLETDNPVVLPVDTNIRLLTTAGDVLHAWGLPAFGTKLDAVPGKLNESWFRITAPGTYYGNCYEICGVGHSVMPIKVQAVSKEEFAAWLAEAQQRFARADGAPPATVAALPASATGSAAAEPSSD